MLNQTLKTWFLIFLLCPLYFVNVSGQIVSGRGASLTGANTWTKSGAANFPASLYSGTWFTGGSATTTKPHVLIEPAGATSTGWSTSGTGLGVNAASGFTGMLVDAQINGATKFRVSYDGTATAQILSTTSYILNASDYYQRNDNARYLMGASDDVVLRRDAAATLQLGTDAASPIAQTIKSHDGSGTDKDGAKMNLNGGNSTGTGRGGSVFIGTSLTGSTGSSANSVTIRKAAIAKPVALTETTATTILNLAFGSSKYVGATIVVTVNAEDATDFQAITSTLNVNAVNKAGTVTTTITQVDGTAAVSAGTLTPVTYTAVANGASVDIKCDATSSLTQTTLAAKLVVTALNSDGVVTITEQ